MRLGVIKEFLESDLQPDVGKALEEALRTLQQLGAEQVELSLPLIDKATAAYYVISLAEASSNLARYDGVRYGYRAQEYGDIHDMMARSRAQGFGNEVIRRILARSEEHTSELQSRGHLVCRPLLEKKKTRS